MDRLNSSLKVRLISTLVLISVIEIGCGKQISAESYDSLSKVNNGQIDPADQVTQSKKPFCEVDYIDYNLKTNIVGYEITTKNNVKLGFNLGMFTSFLKELGLRFASKTGLMQLGMSAYEPLRFDSPVADVTGEAKKTEKEFGSDVDAYLLSLSFNHYKNTPLFKLTEAGLKTTLGNLNKAIAPLDDQKNWSTKIVSMPSSREVIIPIGSVSGIRDGDVLQIFNVNNVWKGKPCESELWLSKHSTRDPLAFAKVIQVEKNAALLEIFTDNPVEPIQVGSKVMIYDLKKKDQNDIRSLKRTMRIAKITSGRLVVDDKNEIDIVGYVKEQLRPIVFESGFVLRD